MSRSCNHHRQVTYNDQQSTRADGGAADLLAGRERCVEVGFVVDCGFHRGFPQESAETWYRWEAAS